MINLGSGGEIVVRVQQTDGTTETVTLNYREPTTTERHRFLAQASDIEAGTGEGVEDMLGLEVEYGAAILIGAGGIDIPHGMDVHAAMAEFGGDYLRLLCQQVFEGRSRTLEVGLGNSAEGSAPSSTEELAA